MKVLVTGVAGFIGSQTARTLIARGDDVIGLDNLNDYYDVGLKQAINQMAFRMDSRAAERTRVGATEGAVIYRRCADIVSKEHARATALNAELPGGQK